MLPVQTVHQHVPAALARRLQGQLHSTLLIRCVLQHRLQFGQVGVDVGVVQQEGEGVVQLGFLVLQVDEGERRHRLEDPPGQLVSAKVIVVKLLGFTVPVIVLQPLGLGVHGRSRLVHPLQGVHDGDVGFGSRRVEGLRALEEEGQHFGIRHLDVHAGIVVLVAGDLGQLRPGPFQHVGTLAAKCHVAGIKPSVCGTVVDELVPIINVGSVVRCAADGLVVDLQRQLIVFQHRPEFRELHVHAHGPLDHDPVAVHQVGEVFAVVIDFLGLIQSAGIDDHVRALVRIIRRVGVVWVIRRIRVIRLLRIEILRVGVGQIRQEGNAVGLVVVVDGKVHQGGDVPQLHVVVVVHHVGFDLHGFAVQPDLRRAFYRRGVFRRLPVFVLRAVGLIILVQRQVDALVFLVPLHLEVFLGSLQAFRQVP